PARLTKRGHPRNARGVGIAHHPLAATLPVVAVLGRDATVCGRACPGRLHDAHHQDPVLVEVGLDAALVLPEVIAWIHQVGGDEGGAVDEVHTTVADCDLGERFEHHTVVVGAREDCLPVLVGQHTGPSTHRSQLLTLDIGEEEGRDARRLRAPEVALIGHGGDEERLATLEVAGRVGTVGGHVAVVVDVVITHLRSLLQLTAVHRVAVAVDETSDALALLTDAGRVRGGTVRRNHALRHGRLTDQHTRHVGALFSHPTIGGVDAGLSALVGDAHLVGCTVTVAATAGDAAAEHEVADLAGWTLPGAVTLAGRHTACTVADFASDTCVVAAGTVFSRCTRDTSAPTAMLLRRAVGVYGARARRVAHRHTRVLTALLPRAADCHRRSTELDADAAHTRVVPTAHTTAAAVRLALVDTGVVATELTGPTCRARIGCIGE